MPTCKCMRMRGFWIVARECTCTCMEQAESRQQQGGTSQCLSLFPAPFSRMSMWCTRRLLPLGRDEVHGDPEDIKMLSSHSYSPGSSRPMKTITMKFFVGVVAVLLTRRVFHCWVGLRRMKDLAVAVAHRLRILLEVVRPRTLRLSDKHEGEIEGFRAS